VIALGDEPTFAYDYDSVPGKIDALRRRSASGEGAPSSSPEHR
jgi:hypothetical protein